MSDGFSGYGGQFSQAAGPMVDDDFINLDMGLETTGGLAGFLAPEGTHLFRIDTLPTKTMTSTEYTEIMVGVECVIIQSNVPGALGQKHTENLVFPGDVRKAQDFPKWQTMMKMLRQKLEGMLHRPFRQDHLQIGRRDFLGATFVATITHSETESKKHFNPDGTPKKFMNANMGGWAEIDAQPTQTPQQVVQPSLGAQLGAAAGTGVPSFTSPAPVQQAIDPRIQGAANIGDPHAQAMMTAQQPPQTLDEAAARMAAPAAVTPEQMAASQMPSALQQAVQPTAEELANQEALRAAAAAHAAATTGQPQVVPPTQPTSEGLGGFTLPVMGSDTAPTPEKGADEPF